MNISTHPLAPVLSAWTSTCGRCAAYAGALWLPYLVLHLWARVPLASMPLIVVVSCATGWGLLVYPALLLGWFAYARYEPSAWWLLPVSAVSALDLWRVSSLFSKG